MLLVIKSILTIMDICNTCYKNLLLSAYSEMIYTRNFKAFTMFSSISDLTGHNSIMFDEIPHHMWYYTWNVLNNNVIFHDVNPPDCLSPVYTEEICLFVGHPNSFVLCDDYEWRLPSNNSKAIISTCTYNK